MFGRARHTTPPRSPAPEKRAWVLVFEGGRFDGFKALLHLAPGEVPPLEVRVWADPKSREPAISFPQAYGRLKVTSTRYARVGCRDSHEAWAAYRLVRHVGDDEDLAREQLAGSS